MAPGINTTVQATLIGDGNQFSMLKCQGLLNNIMLDFP